VGAEFDHPSTAMHQSAPTYMERGRRHNRYTELGAQQQHTEDLVDPPKSARIKLDSIERFGLQELLEHDPIIDVLACCNADPVGLERSADLRMA